MTLRWAASALVLLAGIPDGGWADPLQYAYSNTLSMGYDSNPNMSYSNPKGIWRVSALPSFLVAGNYGCDVYNADLALDLEHSSDTAISSDRKDPNVSLGWNRATSAGAVGASAGYRTQSTRVTELTDTGLVGADQTRSSTTISTYYSGQFSDLLGVSANVGYEGIKYSGSGQLVDYSTVSTGASVTREISERASLYLNLSASRYTPEAGTASTSFNASAGGTWSPTDRLAGNAYVGSNRTSTAAKTGLIGGASLTYDLDDRSSAALNFSRSVLPSGYGSFSKTSRFGANLNYAVSALTSVSGSLDLQRGSAGNSPRTRQFNLALNNDLNDYWSLHLSYGYNAIEQRGSSRTDDHQLTMAFVYSNPNVH